MRPWPIARASLITLAMAVALVDGCPIPTGGPEPVLRRARAVQKAQQTALRPFRPVSTFARITQRWKLFPVGDPYPYRMVIDARRGPNDPWEILYRPHDPEHAFLAEVIEYRRLRGGWDPSSHGPRGAYRPFVTWIAGRVFAARPDLNEVRVRQEQLHVLPAGGGVESTGVFAYEERRRR